MQRRVQAGSRRQQAGSRQAAGKQKASRRSAAGAHQRRLLMVLLLLRAGQPIQRHDPCVGALAKTPYITLSQQRL
jgi:hypothetical protein